MSKFKTRPVMGMFSLIMLNVLVVDNFKGLPISAAYGPSVIFYYILAALLFFLPLVLITSELATTWPKKGGIYVWVREAFGTRWGFFVAFLYWAYNLCWYPTQLSLIMSVILYVFAPGLMQSKWLIFTSIIVLFSLVNFINLRGIKASTWFSNFLALFGTLLPMVAVIILGIWWYLSGHPSQTPITLPSIIPHSNWSQLGLLTGVLFGFIGLEMSTVHAQDVKNPGKTFPRALFYSALIVWLTELLGALAIESAVPTQSVDLNTGTIQAFQVFFSAFFHSELSHVLLIISALCIFLSGLGGVGAWSLGPSKALLAAAEDGCLARWFTKTNSKGVPVNILFLQGIIVILLGFVFCLMPSIESAYWVLSDLTAQLALLAYVFMFAAAIYLRYKHPNINRPYRIAGKNLGIWLVAMLGIIASLATLLFGFIPPKQVPTGSIVLYELILIIGAAIILITPHLVYSYRGKAS